MAKTSQIARNKKRAATAAKYADIRKELKAVINSPKSDIAQVQAAVMSLQGLPRDASPTRTRNRCRVTGRARGYMRKFEMSRIAFRELALEGKLPGVIKSSW